MSRICIVSFANDAITEYASITAKINQEYASRHGYDFTVATKADIDLEKYDIHWMKPRVLLNKMDERKSGNPFIKKYDVVVWIDADCAVHHQEVSIKNFLSASSKTILVSHDGINKVKTGGETSLSTVSNENASTHHVNTGVMIIRNTSWARTLMKYWFKTAGNFSKGHPIQDQGRFVEMLEKNEKGCASKTKVFPAKVLNSEYSDPMQDTFVWHLMKREMPYRVKNFTKLLTLVLSRKPGGGGDRADADKLDPIQLAYDSRMHLAPKSKVAVVMLYDKGILNFSAYSDRVNRLYCARHGYDMIVVRSLLSDRAPQWDKVKAVWELMEVRLFCLD
jgi:hypothetical protein